MALYRAALARMAAVLAALRFHRAAERCCHMPAGPHFPGAKGRLCGEHAVLAQALSIARAASSWSRPVSIVSGGWAAHRTV